MLTKSLGRSIESADQRLVLLAPPFTVIPAAFDNVDIDPTRHADLITQMQRLRGSIYLHDGALESQQLSIDGCHRTPEDDKSWHLLMIDDAGKVTACVWYMEHAPIAWSVDRLRVKHCPLADDPAWRDALRLAIERDLETAQRAGLGYAEVGGWAVTKDSRCTSEGLVLALGGYSLGRMLGGSLGITTATVRHCSSTILRRLGGSDLRVDGQIIPSYYDPRYKCEMELLRFDSRYPTPRYAGFIETLRKKLENVLVVAREPQHILSTPAAQLETSASRLEVQTAGLAA